MDLLRVISHHRARLATPIRTVQKIYNDSDLDGFPFADSVFTRGRAPTNRPLLLIEPNYKVNGEDKSKGQNSKKSSKVEGKSVVAPSDSKTKDTPTSDVKTIDKVTSDAKEGVVKDKKPNLDTNIRDKNVDATLSDGKLNDKAAESENSPVTEQKPSRPAMEENIVLGVALDGSKRTLPIEEGMDTASAEVKELSKSVSGKGSTLSEKDKKDGNTHSSTSSDKK